ncbi:hypothetical protein [Leucobacter sp. G161]|uniref:hypothetical protein n=1 Tax=Leucobacter sp. G161 TaxID=663704 RepID=UPI00073C4366|nr:hypothetical protein [Leucobacter sp. G161]KUF06877.1 hypothetical protein AUL38_10305 [Leucobacter sp. G161]
MEDYVPQSLFWISLALINAGLAEQKNRSRLAWFFLSLLLGPVATFYIVATGAPAAIPTQAADGPVTLPPKSAG